MSYRVLVKEDSSGSNILSCPDKFARAYEAVHIGWFCERHSVKTLCLENLKNYQPPKGYGTHSWRLSSNLWSKVLDTIRYMRQTLGHRYGGIWTVSPAWTSQTCHVCGERGIRVENQDSKLECRGGEYFYCEQCGQHYHADVNAARNIIHVEKTTSSAVPGRTT
jgi:transposase